MGSGVVFQKIKLKAYGRYRLQEIATGVWDDAACIYYITGDMRSDRDADIMPEREVCPCSRIPHGVQDTDRLICEERFRVGEGFRVVVDERRYGI